MSHDLPRGWQWAVLGDLCENHDGIRVPVKASDRLGMRGQYPYYGASGVIDHVNDYLFEGTYLLISEDGANLLARSKPIAFEATGRFWVNNHAHVVKAKNGIVQRYLLHAIEHSDIGRLITGSAQPKITQRNLSRVPIPVPPTAEQERIVAAIEEHFSRLEAVESALKQDLARLDALRSSLLTDAFGANSGLPDGWRWSDIGRVVDIVRGVTFKKSEASSVPGPGLVPIARAGNLRPGRAILDHNLVYVPHTRVASDQYLRAGDVLIATSSGSISVVGKSALIDADWHGAHGAFMSILRAHNSLDPSFLGYWVQSEPIRSRWRLAAAGTNINNLKKVDLLSTPIPICPLTEQRRVVQVIEDHLARIDATDIVRNSLTTLVALRRSILAKAFDGRLVPQDPNDEPASVTLERISSPRSARSNKERIGI